jgi:prepilin-type N-terminal cleavage/methylation domain-containing protein
MSVRPYSPTRLSQAGFSLVELLVVMGLFAVIAGITTINLIRPQTTASQQNTLNQLVSDLRAQQQKAMAGDSGAASTAQPYGVYIQNNQYTLFKGSSYSAADPENFVVAAGANTTITTTFGSSQVIFTKASGEITGFSAGANTITITNSVSGVSTVITMSRYGVLAVT